MGTLEQVWLPMRSPVMRAAGRRYPRPTVFTEIPLEQDYSANRSMVYDTLARQVGAGSAKPIGMGSCGLGCAVSSALGGIEPGTILNIAIAIMIASVGLQVVAMIVGPPKKR